MNKKWYRLASINQATVMSCESCGGGHAMLNYQINLGSSSNKMEEVDYLGNATHPSNNPFCNTYNPH